MPYGLEALGALRIEKGHVTGAEIDGRTSVHDLGLEKMFSKKKDFVGKPLALRPALDRSRPQAARRAEVARRQAGLSAARISSPAPTRRSPAAARATSPPCATARRSRATSRWRCWSAAAQRHGETLLRRRSAARQPRAGRGRRPVLLRQGREPHAWLSRLSALAGLAAARRRRARVAVPRCPPGRSCRIQAWPETLATVRARRIASFSGSSAPPLGQAATEGAVTLRRYRARHASSSRGSRPTSRSASSSASSERGRRHRSLARPRDHRASKARRRGRAVDIGSCVDLDPARSSRRAASAQTAIHHIDVADPPPERDALRALGAPKLRACARRMAARRRA